MITCAWWHVVRNLGDNVCKMVFLVHSECQYVSKNFKLTQGNILGHSLVINMAIIRSLVCNVQASFPILMSPVS